MSARRHYRIERYLGTGGEGIVYCGDTPNHNDPLVLKLFWEPRRGGSAHCLERYSGLLPPSCIGLPPITLLYEGGYVVGLWYTYTELHHVHPRLFWHVDGIAQALVSNYCQMQAYLIRNRGLLLHNDAATRQFMLSEQGRYHFVDFGWGISSVDSEYTLRQGLVGLGLFTLLCSLSGVQWRPGRVQDYRYDKPCSYFANHTGILRTLRHQWATELASKVLSQPASALLDCRFYDEIESDMPAKVPLPHIVIATSKLLYWAYAKLRKVSYFLPQPPVPAGIEGHLAQIARVRHRQLAANSLEECDTMNLDSSHD